MPDSSYCSEPVLAALKSLYAEQDILLGDDALPFAIDESRALTPQPFAIVFPRSHQQVVDTVLLANQYGIALVPSGGRTGLSGGACAGNHELVVSFAKMDKLLDFDRDAGLMTIEAGMVLERLQAVAAESGWFYPVDYASRGSAQMGGAVATNAGGIRVLRYGMTRDWVVGLTVITGAGHTLHMQRCLQKDNAGFDLKNLVLGSEGTLALVTSITVQLTRPMAEQTTLLLGVESLEQAVECMQGIQYKLPLSAAEFFCDKALSAVNARHQLGLPFKKHHAFYLLLEFDNNDSHVEYVAQTLALLTKTASQELDVVVAGNISQAQQLWRYRELISSTLNPDKPYKNDIACRLKHLSRWLAELQQQINAIESQLQVVWFGHLGDGNVHLNIVKPKQMPDAEFACLHEKFDAIISQVTVQYQSTASAEHGVGVLKKGLLPACRSAEEIALYRAIKKVFDPNAILNPGKIFD